MSGWTVANAARIAAVDQQALRFQAYLEVSDTLKEAAWLARIPERTARRYRARFP